MSYDFNDHVEEAMNRPTTESKIALCPICGAPPTELIGVLEKDVVAICCCDVDAGNKKLWNQYAAAMELARMEYALERCESKHEHQYQFHVEEARKRVIEVFGGE